jgi:nitrogen fixation/metabolism regulation signal transduction histidine kinase
MSRRRAGPGYATRALLLVAAAGLPGLAAALVPFWGEGEAPASAKVALALAAAAWAVLSLRARARITRPLGTLANVLGSLRAGDYSVRLRPPPGDDEFGVAVGEVNALAEDLQRQRLLAVEASALLAKVMAEVDVALFAFNGEGRLTLANGAAERLLGREQASLVGRHAEQLGMAALLGGEAPRTVEGALPGMAGPFELRRGVFRQAGLPHTLLVLTDLARPLRERELEAWRRLVRVLGHEINNSLAPIRSLSTQLGDMLRTEEATAERDGDIAGGLEIIARRSEALGRFLGSYARLARLPPPRRERVEVGAWVRRTVALEPRLAVEVRPGPALELVGDNDQLDQLLINLVRNAVDAALETGGGVRAAWSVEGDALEVRVDDDGPGIADASNLFVPFFTTKPAGSGIGLALSRQIAEAHRGTLALTDRDDGRGCRVRLRLPLERPAAPLRAAVDREAHASASGAPRGRATSPAARRRPAAAQPPPAAPPANAKKAPSTSSGASTCG